MPFLMAVALVAAAIGDPVVETVANTGVLGPGYADNNHLSVIPALMAGASLVVLALCRHCWEVRRDSADRRDWVIRLARAISAKSAVHDLPYVLLLQFGALYVMESTEQLIFGGRLLGPAAWLGGPIAFSILAHALVGTACTIVITHAARTLLKRLASIVAIALDFILLVLGRRTCGSFAKRNGEPSCRGNQLLRVRRLHERAPPVLALT